MEFSEHNHAVALAFSRQATSFNASATANAQEILDAIVEHAEPQRSERWFEAACGPGIVSRLLAGLVESVHGVDLTQAMIDTARREAAAAALENVTFEVGDATATSLPDASFDGAVTRFSMHHLAVPARLISELTRLVRAGGKVVVVDHLADEDSESRSWAQEIERLRDPSHWACLSVTHLRQMGNEAGLELASEHTFSFELDFADWLLRGTDDKSAHRLVELAIASRPAGTQCFTIRTDRGRRLLQLQMWLGVWKR